jgi:hypothetical protein
MIGLLPGAATHELDQTEWLTLAWLRGSPLHRFWASAQRNYTIPKAEGTEAAAPDYEKNSSAQTRRRGSVNLKARTRSTP